MYTSYLWCHNKQIFYFLDVDKCHDFNYPTFDS